MTFENVFFLFNIYIYIYIYIYALLHICDYLNKISIGTDMTTEENNSRNETNEEIGVATLSYTSASVI